MIHEESNIKGKKDDVVRSTSSTDLVLPKYRMPEKETDGDEILELIKEELYLDGNERQNLATFCQTYEDDNIRELMDMCMNKNMIDKDEYPQTAEIEARCVHILSHLWNAPEGGNSVGTSTVGSSEACMLGGLAMLFRWREKREKEGLPTDKPNLVTGPVQICWDKFARYFDVELREVPMDRERQTMSPETMIPYIDENTIGVVATLGLTFTGMYEPVEEICQALDQLQEEKGWDLSIHVDGASGGFVAPFCAPDIKWDFRNPRVLSISASSHKFGLTPLGCGFILWRDKKDLPEDLVFHVNYLGGNMPVFQLNFSRPAGQVVSQYYQFMHLGMDGYHRIHMACYETAQYLAKEINKLGPFTVMFDGDPEKGIPCVTWKLKEDADVSFNLYDFADRLRNRGWQVPAYSLPKDAEDIVVQRILVRQEFGLDMAELLMADFRRELTYFKKHKVLVNMTEEEAGGFHHSGK